MATAGFRLESGGTAGGAAPAKVKSTAAPKPGAFHETLVFQDDLQPPGVPSGISNRLLLPAGEALDDEDSEFYWLARETPLTPPAPGDATSCLLVAPAALDFHPDEWSVSCEVLGPSPLAGTSLSTAVLNQTISLKPTRIGSIPLLQVIVRPAAIRSEVLAAGAAEPLRLRIVIDGPTPAASTPSAAALAPSAPFESLTATYPEVRRLLGGVVLNAEALDALPACPARPAKSASDSAGASSSALAPARSLALSSFPPIPGDIRISYSGGDEILKIDLSALGLPTTDTASLRLVHHGETLSIGGLLDSTSVWCYAPRVHTLTDRSDALFATTATLTASPSMAERAAFQTLSPAATEVILNRSRTYDQNLRYERAAVRPLGERFVFNRLRGGQNQTVPFAVNDVLTTKGVQVDADLLGYNQTDGVAPDHYADLTLQGVAIPRVSWEGRSALTVHANVTLASLPNPASLSFRHAVPTGSPFLGGIDYQNLDTVTLRWTGKPRIASDGKGTISLPPAGDGLPRRVTLGGFPAGTLSDDILLLDVTDPAAPIRLTGAPVFPDGTGGVAIEFEAPSEACRFFAQRKSLIASPAVIVPAETPPDLPTSGTALRGIFVRDPVFADALAPLVALRNPGILELNPQAAYNAYSAGQESPEAIRLALAALVQAAPSRAPLPWVLLVGRGSLDRRNYLVLDDGPQIGPFIDDGVETSGGFSIETPTDYPYSLLEGDDLFPDAMVGRIPAKTPAELAVAVNRIVQQDAQAEFLRSVPRKGFIIADEDPGFQVDVPEWVSLWEATGKPSETLYVTDATTTTLYIQQTLEASDGGAAFVLYVGHGNTDRWSSYQIINNVKIPTFATQNQWPVVAALTCLNGYYDYPAGPPTMSEVWTFAASDRGAVANIAPSAVDFYDMVRLFIEEFMRVFTASPPHRPTRVGELLTRGQISYVAKYPLYLNTAREYHLFGDPATDLTLDPPPPAAVADWMLFGHSPGEGRLPTAGNLPGAPSGR